jgi:hypothetical protein
VSRSTRASIATSLCALSVVAGCGESTTHSAAEVQRALAQHGLRTERQSTEPPPQYRTKVAAASLRIGLQLSYYASRLAGLAERKTHRWQLIDDEASVLVANDVPDAVWVQHTFTFTHTYRVDNLVVLKGGPRVDAALADLR